MNTGIESWNTNLLEIGPMYPFPGTEVIWVLIGLATWIVWHVIQGRVERRTLDEEDDLFLDKGRLDRAMQLSSSETLKEQLRTHAESYKGRR